MGELLRNRLKLKMVSVSILLLGLAFCLLSSLCAYADECVTTHYEKYLQKYLERLEENNISVFFSSIKDGEITQILIIEVDSKDGLLIEKINGCTVYNLATILYSEENGEFLITETHGGVYSYERVGNVLDKLLEEKFILLKSSELKTKILGNKNTTHKQP